MVALQTTPKHHSLKSRLITSQDSVFHWATLFELHSVASFNRWVGRWLSSAGTSGSHWKFSAEECSAWMDILTGVQAEGAKGRNKINLESVAVTLMRGQWRG